MQTHAHTHAASMHMYTHARMHTHTLYSYNSDLQTHAHTASKYAYSLQHRSTQQTGGLSSAQQLKFGKRRWVVSKDDSKYTPLSLCTLSLITVILCNFELAVENASVNLQQSVFLTWHQYIAMIKGPAFQHWLEFHIQLEAPVIE